MYKWREGDIVTVKTYCTHAIPGMQYVLRFDKSRNRLSAYNGRNSTCSCSYNWIKLPKPVNKSWLILDSCKQLLTAT